MDSPPEAGNDKGKGDLDSSLRWNDTRGVPSLLRLSRRLLALARTYGFIGRWIPRLKAGNDKRKRGVDFSMRGMTGLLYQALRLSRQGDEGFLGLNKIKYRSN